ncbi:MAG TPA: hypothetical protein VIF39_01165, partial [Hyphomicrobium sp.]
CPICTRPFASKDVIIKYWRWEATAGEPGSSLPPHQLGHLDCVLSLSQMERRNHPPIHALSSDASG